MCVCWSWLCVDFFVRHGFTLEQSLDGQRWAVRDHLRFDIPPFCGHLDCPPHAVVLTRGKAA